jgi:glycosyltransferase involved in cell wall biosynthesis
MRITYLHQYFTTPERGGATRSFEMARRWVREGHAVTMITSVPEGAQGFFWRERQADGIRVLSLPVPYSNKMPFRRRIISFLSFVFAAACKATTVPADVIFATSTPLTIAIPAAYAAARLKVPWVFEVRDMWPDVPIAVGALRHPFLMAAARELEMFAYRQAAHVIALAPGMKEDIVRKGVAPEKVTVIPNGCDLNIFQQASMGAGTIREDHAWLGSGPLVLFAGTLGKANGIEYLIRLAAAALKRVPSARFVLIGDGAEKKAAVDLAQVLGLLGRSVFFLEPMSKPEVARWICSADFLVCLFTGPAAVWKDAVQNKFFDALAAGKPTACNFEGYQSLLARDEGVGIILDPLSPSKGADQLVNRLEDKAWLASVRPKALRLARETFNRDILARELLKALISVHQKRHPREKGPVCLNHSHEKKPTA